MSALGRLVVSLALDHAQYTQGLDRSSQEALKFAQNSQKSFDQAGRSAKEFLGNVAGNIGGAIVSVVGLNAAFSRVTESINILNSLDDAAQKTGSSIEDLSKIEQVARNFGDVFNPIEQGITRLAKGLAEIDDPSSNAIRALDAIGVSARDSNGQLRTAADVYIDVARSLQQYEDGTRKTAVAQALFGKSGAELLPMLNNLAQGVDHVTGVTQANASQAALFNDQLALGKARVTGFFTSLAVDLLPTLNNIASAFNSSTGQIGSFSAGSSVAVSVLKGLAIAGFTVVDTFRGMGREIGARAAQLAALASMDFSGAKFIGQALAEDNIKSRAEYDKFVDTVLNGEQRISQAVDSGGTKKAIDFQVKLPAAVNASTQAIEKQTKAFDLELHKLKEYESEAKRARDITESVATKQERYNQTLEELERLRPHMSVEAYTRALDKAERELQDVGAVNRQVTSEMDQLWIQAGRNIQSTFASSIFDAFNDGVDGMWRNAKTAVGRILSEFAALKFSQSIGLSAMFAIPGAASAGGGIGGTGTSALNLAGMGSSALGLLKSGFGATSLMSSVGGMLPGSVGSFFGGMGVGGTQAAAQAGASALWGASGASTAASMGASVASFAGPAIAIAAVDQIVRMLAGDKMIGGGVGKVLNFVPVLGPLLNGLFGRGPMKQQGTSLTGEIGAEGFESGALQTRFKAKGGLFRSDKIDFARVDAVSGAIWTDNNKLMDFANDLSNVGKELFGLINDTTKQTSSSLRQIGDDLGISTAGIDKFSHSINLLTEKGEMLTEEQIGQEIEKITDGLARSLLPQIDDLAKRGETALQAVSRLGTEFASLVDAATLVLGKSASDARAMISGTSFEGRTGFVDAAGGVDALNQKTAFFVQNFLTDAERLAPAQESLNNELTRLGLSTDLTKDQFRGLVQSFGNVNGVSEKTLQSLLSLAPAFVEVRAAQDQLAQSVKGVAAAQKQADEDQKKTALNDAFGSLQRSVEAERNRATKEYNDALKTANDRINDVNESINKMSSLANVLKSATDSLMPLGIGESRAQIQGAINSARAGNFPEVESIQRALSVLADQGTDSFSTRLDFMRSQAQSAGMVNELNLLTNDQLTLDQRSLAALEANRDRLTDGFNTQMAQLDAVLADAQQQIDLLSGINTTLLSIEQAMGNFNLRSVQAGGAAIGSVAPTGNPGITDQQISDYFKSPRTPAEIARDAANNGISSQQIMLATGFTQGTVDQFFKDNPKIPRFSTGATFVPRTGLSIVERGERIFNTEQNQDLIGAIKQLVREVEKGTVSSDSLRSLIRGAMEETDDGLAMRQVSAA